MEHDTSSASEYKSRLKRLRIDEDEVDPLPSAPLFSLSIPSEWRASKAPFGTPFGNPFEKPSSKSCLIQLKSEDKIFQKVAEPFLDLSCEIEAIIQVQNPLLYSAFHIQKELIQFRSENVNETMLYHSTKREHVLPICSLGLDVRKSKDGFFGRGIYFSDDILKANDYASQDPETGLRCILSCSVALGRVKEFEPGVFDRSLVREPEGFDSVKGFVRNGFEFTIYNNSQVYSSYVILYRMPEKQFERVPAPVIAGRRVVYITASLSEFFNKLHQRAGPVLSPQIHLLIASLLKGETTPALFVSQMSSVLKSSPPLHLVSKIETELAKCRLPPPPPPPALSS